jgi:hypothetical protein
MVRDLHFFVFRLYKVCVKMKSLLKRLLFGTDNQHFGKALFLLLLLHRKTLHIIKSS